MRPRLSFFRYLEHTAEKLAKGGGLTKICFFLQKNNLKIGYSFTYLLLYAKLDILILNIFLQA